MTTKRMILGWLAFVAISCSGSCGCHHHSREIRARLAPDAIKFVMMP